MESPPHQETKNDPRAVDSLRSKAVGSRDVDEVSDGGTASSDERSGLQMEGRRGGVVGSSLPF